MPPQVEGRLVPISPLPRLLTAALTALLAAAALAVAAPTAAAAKPCWERVIDDWYKDSRIDGNYSRTCYTTALRNVPTEIRDYGSFEEDIRSAMLRTAREDRTLQILGPTNENRRAQPNERPRPDDGLFKKAFGKTLPQNADSMPIPLLVLGGLALLLIAAGAAGLVRRQLRTRRTAAP